MAAIESLPPQLRTVPSYGPDWEAWRERVLIYRVMARDECERDLDYRADMVAMCADDPCLDMIVFGAVFEPRDRPSRAKGWWPAIPYAFQVDLMRWIQEVVNVQPGSPSALMGRGDGVIEKARGMAGSWTCCIFAAHGWKYQDGFLAGFMSYKQEVVDKANLPDTLFFKIEGYLGLDPRVPESRLMRVGDTEMRIPVRSPAWMIPAGYDANRHNQELLLAHPTKTNVISGYSTTAKTGVGGRQTVMFPDEAAKFDAFPTVWQSLSAVTDHRIALSSADVRFGSGFRDLARLAERAQRDETAGPAFIRLRADLHPERDELWREEIAARHSGGQSAAEALAREYDLDYDAGAGNFIYRDAQGIEPKPLTFKPSDEQLDFCIDPGIRDMCALHLVKYDPGTGRYGLMTSYVNNGLPAEFYASLLLGSPLPNLYAYDEAEDKIMDEWFIPHGRRIRFFVGDSAGESRGGGNLSSFYGDFREAVDRLSDGRRQVAIWSSAQHEFRHNDPRHAALRWLLTQMDFNDVPEVRRTLEAIRNHRWKAMRDDRDVTSAPSSPVRHWGHDRVTALEFYAAHRKHVSRIELAARENPAPRRVTMSGKAITSKRTGAFSYASFDD